MAVNINDVLAAIPGRAAPFSGMVRVVSSPSAYGQVTLFRLDLARLRAPFFCSMAQLEEALSVGNIAHVHDFNAAVPCSEQELSDTQRSKLNNLWPVLEADLLDEFVITKADYRRNAFSRIAKATGLSKKTLVRRFYDFLFGGMTKLALARRKRRIREPRLQSKGTERRGPNGGSQVSSPDVRDKLVEGCRKYFLNGRCTLKDAYRLTLLEHFAKRSLDYKPGMKLTWEQISAVLVPEKDRPSFHQFRYVVESLERIEGKRKPKWADTKAKPEHRELLGTSRAGVTGPGYRFEIDSTKIQIRIASKFNRGAAVSPATVYIVVDVWSGAIVGYVLSLNNSSWALASQALICCFTDKGDIFTRLKLPYAPSRWPCREMPTRLAADRAELLGEKAEVVPESGIKTEIAAPYRPDRKAAVERKFSTLKHGKQSRKLRLPGTFAKQPGRGDPDGYASMSLTYEELDQRMVQTILAVNDEPVAPEYLPPEALEAGVTSVTHIGLYMWGLEHRAGFTRSLTKKQVISNLLCRDVATVTDRGIYFKQHTFISSVLKELGYFAKAASYGSYKVEVRYHEYIAASIWVSDPRFDNWIEVLNSNPDIERLNLTFADAEEKLKAGRAMGEKASFVNAAQQNLEMAPLDKAARRAEKQAREVRRLIPKSKVKKSIRVNRKNDLLDENRRRAREIADALSPTITQSLPDTQGKENVDGKLTKTGAAARRAQYNRTLWKKAQRAKARKTKVRKSG